MIARVSFDLTVTAPLGRAFVPHIRQHLRAARTTLRTPLRTMYLILINDRTMSELHRRFMNVPGPTDVLTFPLELDPRGRALSGEVYICVPEARRRARERGTRVADELLLYALHGMLHLSGFDDRTPAEYRTMHRTEDRILEQLGVGPVFDPPKKKSRDNARLAAALARRDPTRPAHPKRSPRRETRP